MYLADTEPHAEFHSSGVTDVPWLCSDIHSTTLSVTQDYCHSYYSSFFILHHPLLSSLMRKRFSLVAILKNGCHVGHS